MMDADKRVGMFRQQVVSAISADDPRFRYLEYAWSPFGGRSAPILTSVAVDCRRDAPCRIVIRTGEPDAGTEQRLIAEGFAEKRDAVLPGRVVLTSFVDEDAPGEIAARIEWAFRAVAGAPGEYIPQNLPPRVDDSSYVRTPDWQSQYTADPDLRWAAPFMVLYFAVLIVGYIVGFARVF